MLAAIYARISLDRSDGEGVARQLADCRALAAERGWDAVEYIDNDVSAFRKKVRPEWNRLLEDLRHGTVQAVVAYHPDRLYRRLTDLEDFTAAVGQAEVLTVKAGAVDLTTASGRMLAGILGAVSRHEAERIGERVSRAKKERAAQGKPAGGGKRPYGLTATRDAIVPEEADVIRAVAAAVLAGVPMSSEAKRLNAEGIRTASGAHWTSSTVRRAITSPYVAGLRSYEGKVVGEATWPAIDTPRLWFYLHVCIFAGYRRFRVSIGLGG